MKFYIKNTETNKVIEIEAESYESLSKNFRQAPYELASDEEKDLKILNDAKEVQILQCKTYLNKTDWEHTAFLERGRPYDEVKIKRLQAVEAQDLIKACTTLDELNQINTDF